VVDASTGLFQVKALIDGAQDLPDGLSVSVTTVSSVAENAVIVPSDALYFDDGVAYVYLVRDGKAVRTEVDEALYTRQSTAVSKGLSEGDVVITSWSSMLKDGVSVRVYEQGN
jgi:multidrug efflux pump subunit AcrA (membrane-fusion protein)